MLLERSLDEGRPQQRELCVKVGSLTVLLAYAILSCGHLPLMVMLIYLAMMKATLLAAVSWDAKCLEHDKRLGVARPCVVLTQWSSVVMHLASVSESALVLGLALSFLPLALRCSIHWPC